MEECGKAWRRDDIPEVRNQTRRVCETRAEPFSREAQPSERGFRNWDFGFRIYKRRGKFAFYIRNPKSQFRNCKSPHFSQFSQSHISYSGYFIGTGCLTFAVRLAKVCSALWLGPDARCGNKCGQVLHTKWRRHDSTYEAPTPRGKEIQPCMHI